mmetsp:Transcript_27219/g.63402  ORF Transcript_27219/g.63402 Transcript_27219/m.63402 type:complete len:289 (-) Transcript_27219:118-984(-)
MGAHQVKQTQPKGGRLEVVQADDDRRRRLNQKVAQARATAKKVHRDAAAAMHLPHSDETDHGSGEEGSQGDEPAEIQTLERPVLPPTARNQPGATDGKEAIVSTGSMASTYDVSHSAARAGQKAPAPIASTASTFSVGSLLHKKAAKPRATSAAAVPQDAAAQAKAVRFASSVSMYSINGNGPPEEYSEEEYEEVEVDERQATTGLPPALLDVLPEEVAEAAESMWQKALHLVGYRVDDEEEASEAENEQSHYQVSSAAANSRGGRDWGLTFAHCSTPQIRTESLEIH